MIRILVVEDNLPKQTNIKNAILDNSNIKSEDLHIANNIKEAKRLLYKNYYDLMILDLVLPMEENEDASPENGVRFLDDIHNSPMIKSPIQIIGLSGFSDMVIKYNDQFKRKLWHIIDYQADSISWQDDLKSVIYYLVKIRQQFINESVKVNLYDIAIITALPHPEFEAILKLGGSSWEELEIENDPTRFYKTTFSNDNKTRTIIAATCDQMGMTATSCLTTKMILYFKPKYFIMGGITAGIKDRDLGFGDILIAEQSWDYGSGKMIELKSDVNNSTPQDIHFEIDTRPIQLASELKSKITAFLMNGVGILDKIQNDWPADKPRTKLQAKLGPIASGSYVISSEATLEQIKIQQRKLLGIEMETYGLYYAAEHSQNPSTKAISIKSVSDYGDGQKNDVFQKYAAFTSANFIYHFIINEL